MIGERPTVMIFQNLALVCSLPCSNCLNQEWIGVGHDVWLGHGVSGMPVRRFPWCRCCSRISGGCGSPRRSLGDCGKGAANSMLKPWFSAVVNFLKNRFFDSAATIFEKMLKRHGMVSIYFTSALNINLYPLEVTFLAFEWIITESMYRPFSGRVMERGNVLVLPASIMKRPSFFWS